MYDVLIIGGEPSGLTAAIYIGRADKTVKVIDDGKTMLRRASKVDNYPGFPEGISGKQLLTRFEEQAKRFDVEITQEQALSVNKEDPHFCCGNECGYVPE